MQVFGVPLSRQFVPRYLALPRIMGENKSGKRQRGEAQARALDGQFSNLFTAFESVATEMKEFDEKREVVIKKSRDVQKNSKQAIFSVHRGDIAQASSRLEAAEAGYTELLTLIDETPALRGGSFSHALEEYAEARIFLHFHETKQLLVPADLPQINTEEYLGGLLDFTGELNRWAVIQATSRRVDDVKYARNCVDAVA
jgi:predicted translin family RNA/ssDNA-binding protein